MQEEKYFQTVYEEIMQTWGSMLFKGATSFWETISGADAFDKAGSLCPVSYTHLNYINLCARILQEFFASAQLERALFRNAARRRRTLFFKAAYSYKYPRQE